MKTILAEKPSVAREIAQVVKANNRMNGYIEGNGYAVTWSLGHLVGLAMPENYGIKGWKKEALPILPKQFTLVPRQLKTAKGYSNDTTAVTQLRIIKDLFNRSDSIIVATDAGREGELIFRYIYNYLDCKKPFERLWINSLTAQSINDGFNNLRKGEDYDNLYRAAKARSEADWLVGINATQAVSIAAGRGTYSLGRVQTPTLSMVCKRFLENKHFEEKPYWQLSLSAADGDNLVKMFSPNSFDDRDTAEQAYQKLKTETTAVITQVSRKDSTQEPPLLYDITTLQKDANRKHGFSAEKTLSVAQKLYEAKLITYPRTGSRYIPEDVFVEIPSLIYILSSHATFGRLASSLKSLNRHSVDDKKVTDHHALLTTGLPPVMLPHDDMIIYDMIAGRMIEAFSEACVKDTVSIKADCGDLSFTYNGSAIKHPGWRAVYNNSESDNENNDDSSENGDEFFIPSWREGDSVQISACSLVEKHTKPKPLHTEATLLAAMETAGKDIKDEEARNRMKNCGLGTPATRAAIIETLFTREYLIRDKKYLVPTEKGLAIYSIVKDMKIADVEMTGGWESALYKIETGEMDADTFGKGIEVYASQITSELLSSDTLFAHKKSDFVCPKCKTGNMQFYGKVVKCDNPDCGLPVFRQKCGVTLSDEQIGQLLHDGKTDVIKGFKSKEGKSFDAIVNFDDKFNTSFIFAERKKNGRNKSGK